MIILYCKDPFKSGCHWSGDESELVSVAGDETFSHCPYCEGEDFDEEEEED